MIGKIIDIYDSFVDVKLEIDVSNQANIVNVHVVFEDDNQKIVGEIVNLSIDKAKVKILGEIIDDVFFPGFDKKPSFKSKVRIVVMHELELILGSQNITSNDQINLGYSTIYNNYKINIGINPFFSNHFAILGNTGSGKSFTVSRLIQNIFTSSNYLPTNANIFIFDAYGEYRSALSALSDISPVINTKYYTTNTFYPDGDILNIPIWLLDTDDIALLLEATEPSQLSIIEKAIKLVPIIKGEDEQAVKHCNDIIARAILDILKSGKDTVKISDQIKAILSTVSTPTLNLDTEIRQPGYNRPLKQCLFVDGNGKMLEMELVTTFISTYLMEDFKIPEIDHSAKYTLKDLEKALEFSLISEGILKSDKVFDYANILSVRMHALVNSSFSQFFDCETMMNREQYLSSLVTTMYANKKAQIINFNINYVDDRLAKSIVKILSRMIFKFSTENKNRASIPFHIILEEAHRYIQNDSDVKLLGYNIFDRIAKEGRKYGVILGLITQRPCELSDTTISQCSNFLVLRTVHPKDLKYILEMIPNISEEISAKIKNLQAGNAMCFGTAFKVPTCVKIPKPNPEPLSSNCNVVRTWYSS